MTSTKTKTKATKTQRTGTQRAQKAAEARAAEILAELEGTAPEDRNWRDATALNEVRAAAHTLADAEDGLAEAVRTARDEGHTWAAIGAMLGISRQAAQQRFGG